MGRTTPAQFEGLASVLEPVVAGLADQIGKAAATVAKTIVAAVVPIAEALKKQESAPIAAAVGAAIAPIAAALKKQAPLPLPMPPPAQWRLSARPSVPAAQLRGLLDRLVEEKTLLGAGQWVSANAFAMEVCCPLRDLVPHRKRPRGSAAGTVVAQRSAAQDAQARVRARHDQASHWVLRHFRRHHDAATASATDAQKAAMQVNMATKQHGAKSRHMKLEGWLAMYAS